MAVKDFGGSVRGKPIEVVIADDGGKPDIGLNTVRGWIIRDRPELMFAFYLFWQPWYPLGRLNEGRLSSSLLRREKRCLSFSTQAIQGLQEIV